MILYWENQGSIAFAGESGGDIIPSVFTSIEGMFHPGDGAVFRRNKAFVFFLGGL